MSEMETFYGALVMLRRIDSKIHSLRIDEYFSSRKVIELFDCPIALYLILKKNIQKIADWTDILDKISFSPKVPNTILLSQSL